MSSLAENNFYVKSSLLEQEVDGFSLLGIAVATGGNSSSARSSPLSGSQGVYPVSASYTIDALDRTLHNVRPGVFGGHGLEVSSPGTFTGDGYFPEKVVSESSYLDSIAKGYKTYFEGNPEAEESDDVKYPCGSWAIVGRCDCGRLYAKKLVCGREWCAECREVTECRRRSRWLPKAQQINVMGYMVITFPREVRPRSKEGLRSLRRKIVRGLKRLGFSRGLSRWHYFGESGDEWHPHLNLLLDHGHISPALLSKIKCLVARAAGCSMCVVNYRYSRLTGRKMHMLRYVCRSTFLEKSWDPMMAWELYRFNNSHSWGVWADPPVWEVDSDRSSDRRAQPAALGFCSDCGGEIHWRGGKDKVVPTSLLGLWGFVDIGCGFYQGEILEKELWDP